MEGAAVECLTSAGHTDFSAPNGKCIYSSNRYCVAYAWRGPYSGLSFYVSCKDYGS